LPNIEFLFKARSLSGRAYHLPFAADRFKKLAFPVIISETKNKRLRKSYQTINLSGFPTAF
jgi:hypothetical protein